MIYEVIDAFFPEYLLDPLENYGIVAKGQFGVIEEEDGSNSQLIQILAIGKYQMSTHLSSAWVHKCIRRYPSIALAPFHDSGFPGSDELMIVKLS